MPVYDGRRTVTAYLALLRGVNVGGANRVPMVELRQLCEEIGLRQVRTYIASGNIIFASDFEHDRLERLIAEGMERRFGFVVPVVIRSQAEWGDHVASNPFPAATAERPNLVMLGVSSAVPSDGAADALQSKAAAGERVQRAGDALWIDFAGGAGRSKLTPAALDRAVGAPVTTRNWRTVLALYELLKATDA